MGCCGAMSARPRGVREETLLRVPGASVHLLAGSGGPVELARGDLAVVRLAKDDVAVATAVRVGRDLGWLLARNAMSPSSGSTACTTSSRCPTGTARSSTTASPSTPPPTPTPPRWRRSTASSVQRLLLRAILRGRPVVKELQAAAAAAADGCAGRVLERLRAED